MNQDVNFDDLTTHFQEKIYGGRKGKIRLAILNRDLEENIPAWEQGGLSVLDVGAGLGQMVIKAATYGHDVCINDVSEKMLDVAKASAQEHGVDAQITWQHGAFQDLPDKAYDLVLCHAVLEWLDKPESLLNKLQSLTQQNSYVSLMFYNLDALILHNLIRGNFNKIKNNDFSGMKGGLTPPNPVKPDWVKAKLDEYGFELIHQSGIRVFSDYVGIKCGGNTSDEDVLVMELLYSKQKPYCDLGRYTHFICRRKSI